MQVFSRAADINRLMLEAKLSEPPKPKPKPPEDEEGGEEDEEAKEVPLGGHFAHGFPGEAMQPS